MSIGQPSPYNSLFRCFVCTFVVSYAGPSPFLYLLKIENSTLLREIGSITIGTLLFWGYGMASSFFRI